MASNTVCRPYKDFLTPASHRRFRDAALIALGACWIEATFMSTPDLVWSWLPFGMTGIRTGLLFIACLAVFIPRIANQHTGPRLTNSGAQYLYQCLTTRRTLQTWFWYSLSAFIFCEVYMSSLGHEANLGFKDLKRAYERPRLNERAVLFRCLFYSLAAIQAFAHLYLDMDCVRVPRTSLDVKRLASSALQRASTMTIITTICGFMAYFAMFRKFAWGATYSVASTFSTLAKSNGPTGLTDTIPMMGRFVYSSMLLETLWETTNRAYTFFASADPTRHGHALTDESRDPNGSLINGLRSKKELVKYTAFAELSLIAERFDIRRQIIFQDVERKGGPAWTQIYKTCAEEIQSVITSIDNVLSPKAPPKENVQRLPKVSQPLKQDNVLNASPKLSGLDGLTNSAGSFAKSLGQSHGSPRASKMIQYGSEKVLGDPQALSATTVTNKANDFTMKVLKSPIGKPFRAEFSRRASLLVFGEGGQIDMLKAAVTSLCQLILCSMKEDAMGKVQNDIAEVIRLLTQLVTSMDGLVARLPAHWTDVAFQRRAPEVSAMSRLVKEHLGEVLKVFGEYAEQIRLNRVDYRCARDAANIAPEMKLVRS